MNWIREMIDRVSLSFCRFLCRRLSPAERVRIENEFVLRLRDESQRAVIRALLNEMCR